jgi:hypothetical protein
MALRITKEGFIEVPITHEMIQNAKDKAKELGKLRDSILKGSGNLTGFIGEEVVIAAFDEAFSSNTYEYDVVRGLNTLEVKTKLRAVKPQLSYEASVALTNATQAASDYIFVSLVWPKGLEAPEVGYVCGEMPVGGYRSLARKQKQGDLDLSNLYRVRADCLNMPYERLRRYG